MKKEAHEYLLNEAIKYLGRYPASKKKIEEHLKKKIKNKKIHHKIKFNEHESKEILINNIIDKLDNLKIINEMHYLESMFNYYYQSLFSIKKIRNKLYQKGFDEKDIDEYISSQMQDNPELEVEILKKFIPIQSTGCYIPGGLARYQSSVIMSVIPAKVAGVKRIVVVSPPNSNGKIDPLTIVAADICGATEIYKTGGVQAIAALSFGTK